MIVGPVRRLSRWAGPPRIAGAAFAMYALALLLFVVVPRAFPAAEVASAPRPEQAAPSSHVHGAVGDVGHETSEGFVLVAAADHPSALPSAHCVAGIPLRSYEVVAIDVDITLNRYLDHDPLGQMYVLRSELDRVRSEQAQNARGRTRGDEPAVSIGLQGDAIQPLTLRVNQGECLRIILTDDLRGGEKASLHVHGAGLYVAGSSGPAINTNPMAYATTEQSVTYEWMLRDDEPEGTHYFHSLGDDRVATSHGLFGAVIVEPKASAHLDPSNGRELVSGWSAVIRPPNGPAFREAVIYYHEIGDELYQLLDARDQLIPLVDEFTNAYRPAARALNYRSEPFMNRLALQQLQSGVFDESLSYSSYTFGDPATPMLRSYLGDPLKQRIVHGGSEVFHVHHVHGGAIRWRRQSGVEPTGFVSGLQKHPALLPDASERVDSQSLGPSESFDLENECGSGGCQQSTGDYLIHCHVAHHYFAGMWTIWRVYNTMQDGRASTDGLAPLAELPDRIGGVQPAVTSELLIGRTADWSGKQLPIAASNLSEWVERQLPPRGIPKGYDASVLDWTRNGDRYLNEASESRSWPGHRAETAGVRPALEFDPVTGKLAYPFLRPHLGKRPPFAPGHGPAPFLDPIMTGTELPAPGANGPASVCPSGTTVKSFAVSAVAVPITLNHRANLVDSGGELFVLRDQVDNVRAEPGARVPLTIRANAGEDCIDVTLRSELEDVPENHNFSKVNLHIHFVQFDVQASDGVITGFNYEQSVRPYTRAGEQITRPAVAGSPTIFVGDTERFQPGVLIGIGMDRDATLEFRRVTALTADTITLDQPLANGHAVGEYVSTEFVRYRWYPDVQFGTAFFHDHVNAIASWRHGLFGALIAEPPGSTYHDPYTGREIRSGTQADVHTNGRVSADVRGSFREVALFVQDDNPVTHVGRSTGSSFNLRAEPLRARGEDPAAWFSTQSGDPETPLIEAYLDDPVVVRLLVGGTNDVHTWHLDGHWFRAEPHSLTSPPINTIHLGISERYDLSVPRAGGPQHMAGDYLYYSGRSFKVAEGSWGIFRVHDSGESTPLRRLPGHDSAAPSATAICPPTALVKEFSVSAVEVALPMLGGAKGRIFVLDSDKASVLAGGKKPEPLVLHVNVGDCIAVDLANDLQSDAVSFHADLLVSDPKNAGVRSGRNPPQTVAPGQHRTYTVFASAEVGETVSLVRDWGNVAVSPGLGLYGAIVVGPAGSEYHDPRSGANVGAGSFWAVTVTPPTGPAYRDFALFFQDEDAGLGTHRMPYTTQVDGTVGLNYQAEPLASRRVRNADGSTIFSSAVHGDPKTPVLEAMVGDPVRIHVLSPWSEQAQVFSLESARWPFEPGRAGTDMLSAVQVGGLEAITVRLEGGAAGLTAEPGDYVYGDHRTPYRDAGLWGILRVSAPCDAGRTLRPLSDPSGCTGGGSTAPSTLVPAVIAGAVVGVVGSALLWGRRRRGRRTSRGRP